MHSGWLTPAINPNVVNSGVQFLLAGDCVRAIPLTIPIEVAQLLDCGTFEIVSIENETFSLQLKLLCIVIQYFNICQSFSIPIDTVK